MCLKVYAEICKPNDWFYLAHLDFILLFYLIAKFISNILTRNTSLRLQLQLFKLP